MEEPTAMSGALKAFRDFRATFNEGDVVDEESGLTVSHLDTAIKAMEAGKKIAAERQ